MALCLALLLAIIAAPGLGSARARARTMLSRTPFSRAAAPPLRMLDADDARAARPQSDSGDDADAPMLVLEREDGEGAEGWRARALLPSLLAVSIHNQFARALIFYVVDFGPRSTIEPAATRDLMNVELAFGPETYGLLASVPFTLLFAPVSLLAGAAADVSDRARLTWLPLVCWSAATAWQASSGSVAEVAASRAVQGLAMAFTTPAAFTLLADASAPARRATVFSAYSTGVYVGGGLAALSILLDEAVGWRATLRLGAAAGLGLAALTALTVDDPRTRAAGRREADAHADARPALGALVRAQTAALGRTFAAVAERPEVVVLLGSCALRLCAGFSIAVWVGPWGRGAFPSHESDFAVAKALISALGGSASAIVGGVVSDRLGKLDPAGRLWLPVAGSLGAAACWSLMIGAGSFEAAMCWLLAQYLFAECWFGATIATLQQLLPREVRGGVQGVFSTLTVVGNLAPYAIGQAIHARPLADVLGEVVPALYVASAVAFALTCRQIGQLPGKAGGI